MTFHPPTTESKPCTSISFDSLGHVPTGECHVLIGVPSVRVLLWFRDKEHGMEVTAFELAALKFCDFDEPFQLWPYGYLQRKSESLTDTHTS